MKTALRDWQTSFKKRRRTVIKQIPGSAALFTAAAEKTASRDQDHPFCQNSDFFYLTGLDEPESALLLIGKSRGPRSVLFIRDRDKRLEQWTGERLGIQRAKRLIQVDEVRDISSLRESLQGLLTNCREIHYALGANPCVDQLVMQELNSPVGPRYDRPNSLIDSRLITAEMRFVKDRKEITALRHVADLTAHGFLRLSQELKSSTSEAHAASQLEAHFSSLGAHGVAFPTIVASGKNATTLHHSPKLQPLWKRELLLVDAGASFLGYAGDISRTFPVSGKFTTPQADVYDVVQRALVAATKKAVPGNSLESIHHTAVTQLTRGMVELGILRGNVNELVKRGKYKPWYMHRTSHWLGLDVHDIAPVFYSEKGQAIPSQLRPLEPGNAFTIEPGLYFQPRDESVPKEYRGIGIRLEDDILITADGCKVMTSAVPSLRSEVEALIG